MPVPLQTYYKPTPEGRSGQPSLHGRPELSSWDYLKMSANQNGRAASAAMLLNPKAYKKQLTQSKSSPQHLQPDLDLSYMIPHHVLSSYSDLFVFE